MILLFSISLCLTYLPFSILFSVSLSLSVCLFGIVWLFKGVGNESLFLNDFKLR